ncbi:hypothetical protein [Ectopseudomonas mendocina]|uniref:hypothetical protein n=1 Tax=Ectopseudomonas mendocina TaxID=300 RepID=UPI003F070422
MTLTAKNSDGANPVFKIIISLIIFLCIGATQIAGAANQTTAPQTPTFPSPLVENTKSTLTNDYQIELLKREIEITQKFIDRILATVYWSLGSVVVLTVLLTGFGWYSNTRLHSRDVEAMRKEVENLTRALELELKAELRTLAHDSLTEVSESISPIEKSIKESIRALEGKIERKLADQEKRLTYTEIKQEAGYQELKESTGVELGKRIELLRMATTDGYETEINNSLKRIEKLLASKCIITHYEARRLSKIINDLPAEYTIMTDAIRAGLKESKPI